MCSFTEHEYSTRALEWKGLYKQRSARNSSLFASKRRDFTREELERTTAKTEDGHFKLTITELFLLFIYS